MADRHLTPEQSRRIVESLRAHKGQRVNIVENGDSDEARTFSREIQALLDEAEWHALPAGRFEGSRKPKGVFLLISPEQPMLPAAEDLLSALTREGILTFLQLDKGFGSMYTPPGTILMFVGPKT